MLSQLGDDLLHAVLLSCCHFLPLVLSPFHGLSQNLDQFSGGLTVLKVDFREFRGVWPKTTEVHSEYDRQPQLSAEIRRVAQKFRVLATPLAVVAIPPHRRISN